MSQESKIIWITGAGGLIGNYLVRLAPSLAPNFHVVPITRNILDLTDFKKVEKLFIENSPDFLVHCAAFSQSSECQANPPLAQSLNVDVTQHLANLSNGIPFVFFSSDLIFDGKAGNYEESAKPNPMGVYAETKVQAEEIVSIHPKHLIVRTSLNGGNSPSGDRGFNEQIYLAWKEGQTLNLFTDEYRSPISAHFTARAVWELVLQGQTGVFHVGGAQKLSRYQIGEILARRHPELQPKLKRGSIQDYKGAPRPQDTSLNCSKIQTVLSFPLPGLIQWLNDNPDQEF